MSITSEIPKTITDELGNDHPNWELVLNATLNFFDCTTGTIHTLDQNSLLQLTAHKGISEFLIPKLTTIPIGKGMAGITAERKKPVEMCNLQTDDSGVARPSAKDTKVEGSLAAPLLHDNTLYGTIGIAKPIPYDFSEKEISLLMQIGNLISKKMIK